MINDYAGANKDFTFLHQVLFTLLDIHGVLWQSIFPPFFAGFHSNDTVYLELN